MKTIGRQAVDEAVIKEEARLLSQIWNSKSRAERGNQAAFGETHGVGTQSAVGQFLRGEVPLSLKAARGFARGLNCRIADFSPRLSAEVEDASAVNLPAPPPGQWPFLTVTADQYWTVLTQGQRDVIEGMANTLVAAGLRDPAPKQNKPETITNAQTARSV